MSGPVEKECVGRKSSGLVPIAGLLLSGWLLIATAVATEPPAQSKAIAPANADNQQRKELVARFRQLVLEAQQLEANGKTAEAIAAWEKVATVTPTLLGGDVSEPMARLHERLGELQEKREAWTAAIKARESVLKIRSKLYGDKDWRVTDARLAVQDVEIHSRLTAEQRRELLQANEANARALALDSQGDFRRAIPFAERALEIRRRILGEQHANTAASLNHLAILHRSMQAFAEAEPLFRRALEIRRNALGEQHPDTATSLSNLAVLYKLRGDYAKAETMYRQVLEIRKKVLGELHPSTATSLSNLAVLYRSIGDFAQAEPLSLRAWEIRKKVLGERHLETASSLSSLAVLYVAMGDYAKAEPFSRQALEINKKVRGEHHPETALSLNNLADLYESMGDYAKAEPLCRRALEIRKKALGEKHPDTATSLNNLAWLYQSMGDYAKAEPLFRRALEIDKKALGDQHPHTATDLNNLAALYDLMQDYAKAEPLYRQALEIKKKALGEKHPSTAMSLNNLGGLYYSMDDYAKAEPLYRQALEINQKALGEKHPSTSMNLNNLALLYQSTGDHAKAESFYRQVLEIDKQTLGDQHPDTALHLNNLALLYQSTGESAKAETLCRRALEIYERLFGSTMRVQSERQQLALAEKLRSILDTYLSFAPSAQLSSTEVYRHVLGWKGAVFIRQLAARVARRRPDLKPRFDELQTVSVRLSNLALRVPDANGRTVWKRQLVALSDRKDALETELASKSAEFQQTQALLQLTPAELQQSLPESVALVDFLEYTHYSPPRGGKGPFEYEHRLVAFVVRKDRPIGRVELGAVRPLAAAAMGWRQAILRTAGAVDDGKGRGTDPARKPPQRVLKELLWNPLRQLLQGAQTVLISPDGVLGRIPLGALPGEKPGSYLLEEIKLAIVPVPRLLPLLLETPEKNVGTAQALTESDSHQSLLIVGDVDYGANPGKLEGNLATASRSAVRGERAGAMQFGELPGFVAELTTIKDCFEQSHPEGQVHELRREKATESAFRNEAPKSHWLHLATHGFFAPPNLASALSASKEDRRGGFGEFGRKGIAGSHPGLLSGLALSGANTPAGLNEDDGILTAVEVAGLDLERTDLVVLSACETGLGAVAGGEGVLGLQRAFQTAGVRTCVASLWKVDDAATQALMKEFYTNLWAKKLTRLEALRQAQLTMIRRWSPTQKKLKVRGLDVEEAISGRQADSPYYWAAFGLSGDWR